MLPSLMVGLMFLVGCSHTKTVRVAVAPRVDLHSYPMVGLVTFSSNAKGELDRLSTQKFLEQVQAAQPGTRVIELGTEADVLGSVGRRSWDATTLRSVKETHGVDVVVIGRLDVKQSKPNVSLSTIVKSLSVSKDVDAALSARLLETSTGATMWASGAQCTANVANASFNNRGEGNFGATDPEGAYGKMLDGLVCRITEDFRTHYVTRRVSKDDPAYASAAD
jgi:hypothetical protein